MTVGNRTHAELSNIACESEIKYDLERTIIVFQMAARVYRSPIIHVKGGEIDRKTFIANLWGMYVVG